MINMGVNKLMFYSQPFTILFQVHIMIHDKSIPGVPQVSTNIVVQ